MKKNKCQDCEKYLAIDVFKGLCSLNKEMKMADKEICNDFKPVKKCKFCKHYTSKEEFLGMCMDKTLAYPDLLAKTCKNFKWRKDIDG
ncbi:4-hydroxyphenylacetate decarboxylase small subunit [candidate division WOR-3 bacterium]|jgi:hypothetical protein|nr:4-hydroxyphenylacetate decarboxylase small subunit [candidate division WOR-3 bacterium]